MGAAPARPRLPAAVPVACAEALFGRFAAFLAVVERTLEHAHHEHEQDEEDDHAEAEVRDGLVACGAVEAAPVVFGVGGRGEHEHRKQRVRDDRESQAAHRGRSYLKRGRRRPYHQQPMALLIASDMHKDIAGEPLLRGVSFKLERRERMTIAGRNGAGKTTLLRMLAGETSIDRGELSIAKGVRIALHDQRPPRERGISLSDYVLSGCAEELQIEAQLADLEARMAAGETDEATLARYSKAQARLEALGGYLWRSRASTMAHGLGFRDADLERNLDTFSGGQLTRASLARALATGADVLLLDEPTNHLDIASLEWLEQTLADLDAAVVLVAHDRWFLEAVGTAVLELEAGRSRFFAGSWAQWRKEQAAREIALGKAIDAQQAEIERMERFIERFRYKATKAKQAQSRVKKLAKIERIERDPRDGQALEFRFKPPERTGRVIFELQGGRIEIGGEGGDPIILLDGAELWL